MPAHPLRTLLAAAHRWTALLLALPLLLIFLSGAVLAFKPLLAEPPQAGPSSRALAATVARLDPRGEAQSLKVDGADGSLVLKAPGAVAPTRHDAASGAPLAGAEAFDPFLTALRLHRSLLMGASTVVDVASYALLGILVAALFLGLPRRGGGLLGWHRGLGWFALPLLALTPLTAVLMLLHVGQPPRPPAGGPAPSLARTLEFAADAGVDGVLSAFRLRSGSVFLTRSGAHGVERLMVGADGRLTPVPPNLVRQLHEGSWGGPGAALFNLAGVLGLLALLGTGLYSWFGRLRRDRRRSGGGGRLLVAHASQTGTAAALAERTARTLREAGARVVCASLASLRPRELAGYDDALLIVSTTGEGDLPRAARPFLGALGQHSLAHLRFSLLALGDARYEHFCGGGARLREALLRHGAQEASPWLRVDRDPAAPWRSWLQQQAARLGLRTPAIVPEGGDTLLSLQLVRRARLDDPTRGDTRETWQLVFQAEQPVEFRPGDLLLLTPPGSGEPRCYSIGSSSATGPHLELTVALQQRPDGAGRLQPGHASRWLCRELDSGTRIAAALRRNPDFNPPADPARPLILIAAGAGIAPFPGFLAERAARPGGGPVWLLFGNRHAEADFLHRERLLAWQRAGVLRRLDTAFSRDAQPCRLPELLRRHGAEVLRLVREDGALIYTCGRAGSVGLSVQEALRDILREHAHDPDPDATLARWKGDGILRMDLFG